MGTLGAQGMVPNRLTITRGQLDGTAREETNPAVQPRNTPKERLHFSAVGEGIAVGNTLEKMLFSQHAEYLKQQGKRAQKHLRNNA